jgi:hypothetical protein
MIPAMVITFPRRQENVMLRLAARIAALVALTAFSTAAEAHQVEYVSQHPVPHKFGGGFCTINVPHVHNYSPGDPRMYREARGQHYFVGDPAPFGYDGPRYSYYGAHPVFEAEMRFGHPVYCYIKGPHFHWYQPPAQAQFELSGGAYWYVGTFPPAYYDDRPRYAVINEAYAPMPYTRPVVDVQVAPAVVRAEISFGGPGWRASAVVGGPPVPVVAPPPGPPVQIGVGINLGGPPMVVEPRPGPPGHFQHDHGRHEGWQDHHGHGPPPARFIAGPAPVRQPLFEHRRGQQPTFRATPAPHPAPAPARTPMGRAPVQAPRLAPATAPARGPAPAQGRAPARGPAPAQGHADNPQDRRH